MQKRPTFPLYYKDFLLGTKYMNCEEIGAYFQLLIHQWDDGFLPNAREILAQLIKTTPKKLDKVLQKFTLCEDGCLRNLKCEEIRAENDAFREKKALAGLKSGNKRRTKG